MRDSTSDAQAGAADQSQRSFNQWVRAYGTFAGFIAMIVIFALLRPGIFLSLNNLRNITEQVAILAIVSTR